MLIAGFYRCTYYELQGDLQQLTIVPNPEAAYELCTDYVPDCDKPLPGSQQKDDSLASYRGMSEDELLNREGVSPQEYLEFTERFEEVPPPPPPQNNVHKNSLNLLQGPCF